VIVYNKLKNYGKLFQKTNLSVITSAILKIVKITVFSPLRLMSCH